MDVTCIKNFIINRALQVKLFLNHKNTSLHVFECYLHLDSCADEKLNKVKLPAKKNKIWLLVLVNYIILQLIF